MKLWTILKLWWIALRKLGGDLIDVFKPKGIVTLTLKYAHGPKKGQVYKVVKGRNIITSTLSGTPGSRGGRDIMRRLIIPQAFSSESLNGDDDSSFSQMELGSGTTAETSLDSSLVTPVPASASLKSFTSVELDGSNPYVTFIVEYDESEVNQTISEMGVSSAHGDFVARKTFTPFTKTNEFTLEVRYQVRF